ncbi:hypothetical protein I79_003417 [Cricetulus griseus]|uniref:Uncharacterized protein n=1 Tax=Cricetulus griseus TaxID=10029 RepID=G3GZW9_CRIGR|nr:hypothetical protein I79_003417 [Cricetulus griseus]
MESAETLSQQDAWEAWGQSISHRSGALSEKTLKSSQGGRFLQHLSYALKTWLPWLL